jgi:hypothetical protein
MNMRASYNGNRRGWRQGRGGIDCVWCGNTDHFNSSLLVRVKERPPHLRSLLTKALHGLGIPIHTVWREVYLRTACYTVWHKDLQVVIAMETELNSYPLSLCCIRTRPKTIHYMSLLYRKLHSTDLAPSSVSPVYIDATSRNLRHNSKKLLLGSFSIRLLSCS